ncbi:T9SS type A sorting domain-containing protein [Cryomorphaceae bacterium]|nr:T9SS type A sorting domain-containing protein [Cryomorphaceae bacterium]
MKQLSLLCFLIVSFTTFAQIWTPISTGSNYDLNSRFKSPVGELIYVHPVGNISSIRGTVRSWYPYSSFIVHPNTNHPGIAEHSFGTEWFGVEYGDGKLLLSTDNFISWNPIAYFDRIRDVASPDSGIVVVLQNNDLYRSEDYGGTWDTISLPGGFSYQVHFVNDQVGYALIEDSGWTIYRSSDAGITWNRRYNHTDGITNFGQLLQYNLVVESQDEVIFVIDRSKVFKSTNQGVSFQELSVSEDLSFHEDLAVWNVDTFAVAGRYGLDLSLDGGQSFTTLLVPQHIGFRIKTAHFMGPRKILLTGEIFGSSGGSPSTNMMLLDLNNLIGISEWKSAEGQLYPNPSQGEVHLKLDEPMRQCEFVVYDLQGRVILEDRFDEVESLDLHLNIPSGVYVMTIYGDHQYLSRSFEIIR